jgi:CRP-like cAMP-binding protein
LRGKPRPAPQETVAMPRKLNEIYRQAEADFLEGKFDKALAGFTVVVRNDPNHLWSRFQIARTLEGLKEINRAFDVYKALSLHCMKAGFPLLGLDATKRAAHMQAGFESTLQVLAEYYGLESDRIDQTLELPPPPELNGELSVREDSLSLDKLVVQASQAARTIDEARYPKKVPPTPLFSLMTTEAIYPLLQILDLHTYQPGQAIVNEGDLGTSVYLLAHGEVQVQEGREDKSRTLARFGANSVFGEMALITDAPRVASAVAIKESDVLELRREDLEAAATDIDDMTLALARFVRQRFLNNLLLTSPVFVPFSPQERREILDRFTSIGVPTDEVVIREGTPGTGLYMILGGEVEVSKFQSESRVHLANLKEGSVFGEISLIRDTPTTATVKAIRGGEFLFLSRQDFQELIAARPEIRKALQDLSDERLAAQQQAMTDAEVLTTDGSILF